MGQHNVRVDDVLWSAAMAKALTEGKTVTDVITEALRAYTGTTMAAGITIQPDVRMPSGIAALTSPGQKPVIFPLPPAEQPWSRPDARPLEDIREIERVDRRRTARPFDRTGQVCPHPKARVIKGLCGNCGTGGLG